MNDNHQQQQDMEAREWELLEALQRVYRAGLTKEAELLAFEGGVLTQFKKELELRRKSHEG